MLKKLGRYRIVAFLCLSLGLASQARAQQTLGGITGTVTDHSGAVIPGATVTIVGDQTKLTRTVQTTDTGATISSICPSAITRSRSLTRVFKR